MTDVYEWILTSRLSASCNCSCFLFSSSSNICCSITALASSTRLNTSVSISSRLRSSSSLTLLSTSSSIRSAAAASTVFCWESLSLLNTGWFQRSQRRREAPTFVSQSRPTPSSCSAYSGSSRGRSQSCWMRSWRSNVSCTNTDYNDCLSTRMSQHHLLCLSLDLRLLCLLSSLDRLLFLFCFLACLSMLSSLLSLMSLSLAMISPASQSASQSVVTAQHCSQPRPALLLQSSSSAL